MYICVFAYLVQAESDCACIASTNLRDDCGQNGFDIGNAKQNKIKTTKTLLVNK